MMKKRIVSWALALVLLATLPCVALADNYTNFGQVPAGSPLSLYIASTAPGSAVSYDLLPPGCELQQDLSGTALYLAGTPVQAGAYSFAVSVTAPADTAATLYTCAITVLPAAPTVSTSANVSCYVGGAALLSIGASVSDGGTLSYQWYVGSGAGGAGAPIPGATGPEYNADTSVPGVSYYYCEVTNSNGGYTSAVTSNAISVSVTQAVAQSIMLNSLPQKTRYLVGERLDPAGLSIAVTYSDGTQQVVSSGFEVFPSVFDSAGKIAVELRYDGKSCSFPVTVLSEEESLAGIGMVSLPFKTEYRQGESLETAGLIFRAYYLDNSYQDIDAGYTYAPRVLNTAGQQTVTVNYKNKTCTFTVTVRPAATVSSLSVASTPRKLSYKVGDTLDTAGLVLKLTDGDKVQIINDGFTCTPTTLSTPGQQTVTVSYGGYSASFTVTVNAAASPSPTLAPSPSATLPVSPGPSTPAPAATASPGAGMRRTNGVLVAVMVLALLCLIALGLYMLIMNAGGIEAFKNQLAYRLYKLRQKLRRK